MLLVCGGNTDAKAPPVASALMLMCSMMTTMVVVEAMARVATGLLAMVLPRIPMRAAMVPLQGALVRTLTHARATQ